VRTISKTLYVTEDGCEWETLEAAADHELATKVSQLMKNYGLYGVTPRCTGAAIVALWPELKKIMEPMK
jgi:hypothetical protein